MIKEIEVPEIGENVESGVVVAVHVKAGDAVAVDDTVIELETDKALVEIPSPFDGRVTEVLAVAGEQMKVGDVIARVDTEADGSSVDAAPPGRESSSRAIRPAEPAEPAVEKRSADNVRPSVATAADAEEKQAPPPRQDRHAASREAATDAHRRPAPAAPSIRRLARELGVDIHAVQGSGPGGRISEADVKAHVRDQLAQPSQDRKSVV